MKQTEIGMIPDDWEVRKFKSLTTRITVGIANSATHAYSDKGIIMFRNQNIKANYLDSYDLIYIKEEFANKYSNKQIKENDLLIARTGYPGTTCVVPKKYSGAQTFTTLIASPKCGLDSNYCAYFFNSNIGKRLFAAAQIGGAQKNVNANTLSNICISLPPTLAEQQKIAKALSDIDNVISTLEKLITKKKNLKQGTMQQLLTGKKRLPGFAKSNKFKQTEIGEIPEDWEVKELSSLCSMITKQTGFDYSATIKPALVTESQKDTLPFIQNKDFEEEHINFATDFYIPITIAKKFPRIYLNEDVLLISISGRIGNVAHFKYTQDSFIGGAVGIARFKDPEIINFCMRYLMSPTGQKQIFANEKSGAQHNLTVADVRKLRISLPSKSEQSAITNVLSSMDKEIEALETKLGKYRNLKTGMMQQLLTGKIRLV